MKILDIIYTVLSTATLLNFATIFFVAYSTPQKAVYLTFNEYGEANPELIILIILLILMLRFWLILFQNFMRLMKERINKYEIEKIIEGKYP